MISPGDVSVVVQGAVTTGYTIPCLESIRRHLPGAEVIVSTFAGGDALPPALYDRLVISPDPGAVVCTQNHHPPRLNNLNRQIVSTQAGLRHTTRPYVGKLRSDMVIDHPGFLSWWGRYPARGPRWRIFNERLLSSTVYARNPRRLHPYPFHPSDWFFFGRRDDLTALWEIPLAPEPAFSQWYATRPHPAPDRYSNTLSRLAPEQYLWTTFLRLHAPPGETLDLPHAWDNGPAVVEQSEQTLANNLVLLAPHQLGIRFVKYPLERLDWASLYTHGEWLRLYNRWGGGNAALRPDPDALRRRLFVRALTAFSGESLQPLLAPLRRHPAYRKLGDRYRRLLR